MDTSLTRKPSLLSDLRWDPVSGSCVLKSSLHTPDADTNSTQDSPDSRPIRVNLSRRASAPLPSGSRSSDEAISNPYASPKAGGGKAIMENNRDPIKSPISKSSMIKREQRTSISTSLIEKNGKASSFQQKSPKGLKDTSPSSSKTISGKSFFGVLLRPASFSGLLSHGPFKRKSLPNPMSMPVATKDLPEMYKGQGISIPKADFDSETIEAKTQGGQKKDIACEKDVEKSSGAGDEKGDTGKSHGDANKLTNPYQQQHHHYSPEQQHEPIETQNVHAQPLKHSEFLNVSKREPVHSKSQANENSQQDLEAKISNIESKKHNLTELSDYKSLEQNYTGVSVNKINADNVGQKRALINQSNELNQVLTSTNVSREANKVTSTNENAELKHAMVSANENSQQKIADTPARANEIHRQGSQIHLRRNMSLPYDQSVLKKRGSWPLKSGVPSFTEAKQMFAVGNKENPMSHQRKSSASDTQTIRVNVRDLVRRMSDSCPGTGRKSASFIASGTSNQRSGPSVIQQGSSESELPKVTQQHEIEKSIGTESCPKWRQGIEIPSKPDSNKDLAFSTTEGIENKVKRPGFSVEAGSDSSEKSVCIEISKEPGVAMALKTSEEGTGTEKLSQSRQTDRIKQPNTTDNDGDRSESTHSLVIDKPSKNEKDDLIPQPESETACNTITSDHALSASVLQADSTLHRSAVTSENSYDEINGSGKRADLIHISSLYHASSLQEQASFEVKTKGVTNESVTSLEESKHNTVKESFEAIDMHGTPKIPIGTNGNKDLIYQNPVTDKPTTITNENLQSVSIKQDDTKAQTESKEHEGENKKETFSEKDEKILTPEARRDDERAETRKRKEKQSSVASLISKFSATSLSSDGQSCPHTSDKSKRPHNHHHRLSLPSASFTPSETALLPGTKVKLGRSNSLRGPVDDIKGQGHDQGSMFIDQAEIERLLLKSLELRRSKQRQSRQNNSEPMKATEDKMVRLGAVGSTVAHSNNKDHTIELSTAEPLSHTHRASKSKRSDRRLISPVNTILPLHLFDQNYQNTKMSPSNAEDQFTKTQQVENAPKLVSEDQKSQRVTELIGTHSKARNTRRTTITAVASSAKATGSKATKTKTIAMVSSNDNRDFLLAATSWTATKPPPAPLFRKTKQHPEVTTAQKGLTQSPRDKHEGNVSERAKEKSKRPKYNAGTDIGYSQQYQVEDTNSNGSKTDGRNGTVIHRGINTTSNHPPVNTREQLQERVARPPHTSNGGHRHEIQSPFFFSAKSFDLPHGRGAGSDDEDMNENVFVEENFRSCYSVTKTVQTRRSSPRQRWEERSAKCGGDTVISSEENSESIASTIIDARRMRETRTETQRPSQAERIARYKEDRRRQLAYVSEKVGLELTAAPGLNLSPKASFGQQRRRSSTSTNSSSDSKHGTQLTQSESDQRCSDSTLPNSTSSNSEQERKLRTDCSGNRKSESHEVTEYSQTIPSQVSHRSEHSTTQKHDCVFKRLTSTAKKSPRCRKSRPELEFEESGKFSDKSSTDVCEFRDSSKQGISEGRSDTAAVIRSSLTAAKKSRQAGQSISSGLGPREVCAINTGTSNIHTERRDTSFPKRKTTTPKSSPRGNKDSGSATPRNFFYSRAPTPSSNPSEQKDNSMKNQSSDSGAKITKINPRESVKELNLNPYGSSNIHSHPSSVESVAGGDKSDMLRAGKIELICEESAATPTEYSTCVDTQYEHSLTAPGDVAGNGKASNLSTPKGFKTTHTTSVFSKGFAVGMKKTKTEKFQTQVNTSEDQMSFTRQHLSKPRPLSHGFANKLRAGDDGKFDKSKPENSSEGKGSQNIDSIKSSSGVQRFDVNNWRRSLLPWDPTTKVGGSTAFSKTSLAKRASLRDSCVITSSSNRAERLQDLRREQSKALSQFKKFIHREERAGNTATVTHVTEERVSQVQECSIRVGSVKEAESLAKALVESVRQGKSPEVCLQHISSTYPGCIQSQLVIKEPGHQLREVLGEEGKKNNLNPTHSCPTVEASDIFYDAVESCSNLKPASASKEEIAPRTKECLSPKKCSPRNASYAADTLSSCAKTGRAKLPPGRRPTARKQTLNLQETNSIIEGKTAVKQDFARTGQTVSKAVVKQNAEHTSEADNKINLFASCSQNPTIEKSMEEKCPTLLFSGTEENGFTTAESLLDCNDLTSIGNRESGYRVVQAMSPRPVVAVMIVPDQEMTTKTGPVVNTDKPCIEVSNERKDRSHPHDTNTTAQTKENKLSSFNISETINALGEKIVSFLSQEHRKLLSIKDLNFIKESEPAPHATEPSAPGANGESRNREKPLESQRDPVSISPITVTGSSTLTISSQTTVCSGPYPASTAAMSTTGKFSDAEETQAEMKSTSTNSCLQESLGFGGAQTPPEKSLTHHYANDGENPVQDVAYDVRHNAHCSQGVLDMIDFQANNIDTGIEERHFKGKLVGQFPSTDDLNLWDIQNSEYHTVPSEFVSSSFPPSKGLKLPKGAKTKLENKTVQLEKVKSSVAATHPESSFITKNIDVNKATIAPQRKKVSPINLQTDPFSNTNIKYTPESKISCSAGGSSGDQMNLHGSDAGTHRHEKSQAFTVSNIENSSNLTDIKTISRDIQTSATDGETQIGVASIQGSLNPPNKTFLTSSGDEAAIYAKETHTQLSLSVNSSSETLRATEKANACKESSCGKGSDVNGHPYDRKYQSNDLAGVRSSTFIKQELDIRDLSGKDKHIASEVAEERSCEIKSQTQGSSCTTAKNASSQTIFHTYKDTGTDSPRASPRIKDKNVRFNKPPVYPSSSPHSQASLQTHHIETQSSCATTADGVNTSLVGDRPKYIDNGKTKNLPVANEKPQNRAATFVVKDQFEGTKIFHTSEICLDPQTKTSRVAKLVSKDSGDTVSRAHAKPSPSNRSPAGETEKRKRQSLPANFKWKTRDKQTFSTTGEISQANSKDSSSLEFSPPAKSFRSDTFEDLTSQHSSQQRGGSRRSSRATPEELKISPLVVQSPYATPSQLDLDYLIKNLDVSSDTFDSLYLQNAMYLKGAATTVSDVKVTRKGVSWSRSASHESPLTFKRPGSAGSAGLTLHSGKAHTCQNRRRSPLMRPPASGRAACRAEELTPSPRQAWRINKGRLPSPCVQKAKKQCRRLPRPPVHHAPRGGAKRQLPTPNGRQITKRRVSHYKPRSLNRSPEAASDLLHQHNQGVSSKENVDAFPEEFEARPKEVAGENLRRICSELSDDEDNGERDHQGFLEVESDSDMEARRRRRLLERVARVASEEAGSNPSTATTSWRSKVYNDEVASRPEKDDNFPRRRSQDFSRRSSRDSCDLNNVADSNGFSESRESDEAGAGNFMRRRSSRRLSEESNCSDQLSERLAKRRAQRLEEAGDSSSLDSSFDSPRPQRGVDLKGQRRSSRDVAERSEDDGRPQNGHQSSIIGQRKIEESTKLARIQCVGETTTTSAWGDPRQISADSTISMESVNDPDEGDEEDDGESEQIRSLRRRRKLRRRQSEESAQGSSTEQRRSMEMGDNVSERRMRGRHTQHWGGEDSSFQSTESNASFRSCEDWSTSGQWTSKDSRTFSEEVPFGMSNDQRSNMQDSSTVVGENNSMVDNRNNNIERKNGTTLSDRSSFGDIYSLAPTSVQPELNVNKWQTGNSQTDSSEDVNGQGQQMSSGNTCQNDSLSDKTNGNFDCHHQNLQLANLNPAFDGQQTGNTSMFSTASTTNSSDHVSQSSAGNGSISGVTMRKKKTRKDKSALRKSPLNMAILPSDEDTGPAGSSQDERRTRLRTEGSVVSQHASFWEHRAPLITQHAPASRPTGFSDRILAKINATRQKFCQNEAAAATADAVASASDNNNSTSGGNGNVSDGTAAVSSRKISARGRTDFGQLLQKFSKSESSNSEERSDGEAAKSTSTTSGVTRHRSFVRRQGAEEKASSSGSEVTDRLARRTPERAQSLRLAEKSAMFSAPGAVKSEGKSGPLPSTAPSSSSESSAVSALTKSKMETSTARSRVARVNSGKEIGSGNNSEDGGNSSSSSASSRSGFRSEFMAKRLAGQKKVTDTANSSTSPSTSSLSQLKHVSTEQNGLKSLVTSSKATPDVDTKDNGSLKFVTGRTGENESKQATNESSDETVENKVLILGGVTTTASSDSSMSLGILPGTGESSTDDILVPGPAVTEEKKSPRSAFLTRLGQTPEKSSSQPAKSAPQPEKSAPQPEREVGSLLRSLRTQKISNRSPSVDTLETQGISALSQSSNGAKQSGVANNAKTSSVTHDTKHSTVAHDTKLPAFAQDTKQSVSPHDTKASPHKGSGDKETATFVKERKTSYAELTPVTISTTQKMDKAEELSKSTEKESTSVPVKSNLLNVDLNGSKSAAGHETFSANTHLQETVIAAQVGNTSEAATKENNKTPVSSKDDPCLTLQKSRANTISTISTNAVSSDGIESGDNSKKAAPSNSSIKRSASMREVHRNDVSENKPKGILKRASSLSKPEISQGSTFPVVDPQLAKILQQRKKLVGDVEEKEEEEEEDERDEEENVGARRRKSRALSAAEEIEETLKYSQQLAAERGRDPEADEALKRRSVAERVYFMQSRIEGVERSSTSAFTSRPRSGSATPRSRPISGIISPTQQVSLDESLAPPPKLQEPQQNEVIASTTVSTTANATPTTNIDATINATTTTSNNNSNKKNSLPSTSSTVSAQQASKSQISSISLSTKNPPNTDVANTQQNISESSTLAASSSTQANNHGSHVIGSASPPNKPNGSQNVLSGSQLMEKLTQLADATEVYQERRQKFTEKSKGGAKEKGGVSAKGVSPSSSGTRGRGRLRSSEKERYQTQPITVEEIRAADSLETVSAFRALVRKKSAEGALEQLGLNKQHVGYSYTPLPSSTIPSTTATIKQQIPLQQQQTTATAVGKRAEFPQHIAPASKGQRRVQRLRRRTLPVTAEELNSVPENTMLVTAAGCTKEGDNSSKARDTASPCSRYDSGILSESSDTVGSTGNLTSATSVKSNAAAAEDELLLDHVKGEDEALRHLVLEMDVGSNDPCRMSLSAKTSLFQGLEEKTKAERDKEKSASGARRYINRKKRERSQTMPITDDEMSSATQIGSGSQPGGPTSASGTRGSTGRVNVMNLPKPEVVNRSRPSSMVEADEAEQSDDELTKLSLSEKVKLFSQLKEKDKEKEKAPAKSSAPVNRRRNRKQASRFNTQPVTSEEVEKAAEFSRISPLAMSLVKPPDPEILKTLSFKDQRQMMAQHAEMCLSQASSRAQSRSGSVTSLNQSQPGSRRQSVTVEDDLEGEEKSKENKGILKVKSTSSVDVRTEVKSILKTEQARERPGLTSAASTHSILKHSAEEGRHSDSGDSEPRGILKRRSSQDGGSVSTPDVSRSPRSEVRGILKRTGSREDFDDLEGSPRERSRSNSQPSSGILKEEGSSHASTERKGILKGAATSSDESSGLDSGRSEKEAQPDSSSSGVNIANSPRREQPSSVSTTLESKADSSSSAPTTALEELQLHLADRRARLEEQEAATLASSSSSSSSSKPQITTATLTNIATIPASSAKTTNGVETTISSDLQKSSVQATSSASNTCTANEETLPAETKEDASGLPSNSEDGEGESSAGELLDTDTPKRRLKRKSRFADRAARNERYKTQPPELSTEEKGDPFQDAETTPRRKFKYEGRHMTQPITPDEMREAEATTPAPDLTRTPGGSIADRLNQLKTSGEEEWRRRVGKKDDLILTPNVVVKLREKSCEGAPRPTSIADRLNQIETAKSTWRERVEETDVKRFTVAGKLSNTAVDSPLVQKLKNLPKTEEPSSKGNSPLASPSTPTKESIAKIPIPKEIIHDPTVTIETSKPKQAKPVQDEEEEAPPVQVEVPSIGEEMESFFSVKSIEEIRDTVEVTADDFDNIFIEANDILPTVRKLRPQRKTKARSLNPMKTMSQRLDIKQEYTQVQLGTAEKEFKRMKKENLARDAGFAQAALAGLASKENFSQVELRRSDSASLAHGQRLDPFSELMLLHVKGRRTVQTRLVEPHGRSINSGDCYILVTPEKIIQWEGQFANVIEKAKASEIAGYIQQKKDLGCKKCNEVQTVTQARDHLGAGKAFWAALEGDKQSQAAGPDNEDELYENSITRCNMIYRLEGNALLPYEEYWGVTPRHTMLKRNEVLVFDFGPEFYIWQGKGVTMEQRKLGMKLAKQLFDKGYDYSMSAVSPFSPLRTEEDGGLPTQASKRPKWTIFGKVNQNMETILFREKFADWPDSSRLIGVKGQDASENSQKEAHAELKPYDATQMLPLNTAPVSLKLDGAHVGRGVKWSEDMQGFIKTQEIVTLEVTVWHVLEYEHCKLPALSRGQFHEGDTYVVRWQYMITNANLKSLKGSAARNSLTGRERCAYFFWQGNSSTINEKGASALMTVELDEERGPQVRVLQGKEPPCFLNLFGGSMIVHVGKREDPDTNTKGAWRLYCVKGDYENEICLQEIPVSIEHLRSRSSLFLLNVKTGLMYLWHGAKSPSHIRECCRKVVEKLKENTPLELSLHNGATLTAVEVNEGEEKSEIWAAFDSKDRKSYSSLLTDPLSSRHTLRLFHMSSVNMTFEVHEQLNPSRVHDHPSPFPFLQADLYKSTQPALFMLDNHHAVYLWQGWWPVGSYDHENVHTGSATARFNMDRRCAMETVLHYCRVKDPDSPPRAYLICAGVEPKHFTSLFPFWEVDEVVKDIALEEGRSEGYQEKLEDVLQRITQTRYTLAQLQERPLPEGVDPLRLEAYLDDEEFQDILEMDKEEFYQMPAWKQKVEKQRVGLF